MYGECLAVQRKIAVDASNLVNCVLNDTTAVGDARNHGRTDARDRP